MKTLRESRRPFTYSSGAVYKGQWIGGFRDGFGVIQYPNGAKYTGEWYLGIPWGHGKFYHVDGDLY